MKTEHLANKDFSNGTDAPLKLEIDVKSDLSEFINYKKAKDWAESNPDLPFYVRNAISRAAIDSCFDISNSNLSNRCLRLLFNRNSYQAYKIGMGL